MNVGKEFESDIKNSVDRLKENKEIFFYRFKDSPISWNNTSNTTFTVSNICDCLMFKSPKLALIELKTTKGKSYSITKKGFQQIDKLSKIEKFKNLITGFIINFRELELTYFITIENFLKFLKDTGKKSIRFSECEMYGKVIPQKVKRVRPYYTLHYIFE